VWAGRLSRTGSFQGRSRFARARADAARRLLPPAPTFWPHPRRSVRASRQGHLPARKKIVTESVPRSTPGPISVRRQEPRESALSLCRTAQKLAETAWHASTIGRYPGYLAHLTSRCPETCAYGQPSPESTRPFPGSTLQRLPLAPTGTAEHSPRTVKVAGNKPLPGAKGSLAPPGTSGTGNPFEHT